MQHLTCLLPQARWSSTDQSEPLGNAGELASFRAKCMIILAKGRSAGRGEGQTRALVCLTVATSVQVLTYSQLNRRRRYDASSEGGIS